MSFTDAGRRLEDIDLSDVLFSQMAIKFPKPGDSQSSPLKEKPHVTRKVLMGSDFSRLIEKGRSSKQPGLPLLQQVQSRDVRTRQHW